MATGNTSGNNSPAPPSVFECLSRQILPPNVGIARITQDDLAAYTNAFTQRTAPTPKKIRENSPYTNNYPDLPSDAYFLGQSYLGLDDDEDMDAGMFGFLCSGRRGLQLHPYVAQELIRRGGFNGLADLVETFDSVFRDNEELLINHFGIQFVSAYSHPLAKVMV